MNFHAQIVSNYKMSQPYNNMHILTHVRSHEIPTSYIESEELSKLSLSIDQLPTRLPSVQALTNQQTLLICSVFTVNKTIYIEDYTLYVFKIS